MSELPDFEKIARQIAALVDPAGHVATNPETPVAAIAEQLRLIWNARGAADIARLKKGLPAVMGPTAARLSMEIMDRALRTLDR